MSKEESYEIVVVAIAPRNPIICDREFAIAFNRVGNAIALFLGVAQSDRESFLSPVYRYWVSRSQPTRNAIILHFKVRNVGYK